MKRAEHWGIRWLASAYGRHILICMAFDLYLAPPSGFLEWSDEAWEQFFSQEPTPEGVQIGKGASIAAVLEAISHNLEADKSGSRFPLLRRIHQDEKVGWYRNEIALLLLEIQSVKSEFASLPINRFTLSYDSDEDVRQLIAGFKARHPSSELQNLYDVNSYFIDTFEKLAQKAEETGQGLVVIY